MRRYTDDPTLLDHALETLLERGAGACLSPAVTLSRHWLERPDTLALAPHYQVVEDGLGLRISARLEHHQILLDQPVLLEPAFVPKPWGQEIWFTGIEARGESQVVTAAGRLPLSQYLSLAPRRLCRNAPLVLLKVLDPKHEPVLGDLYFELHEEKQEVYVVTRVDPAAWPDGVGRMRFGMNQDLRARYRGDDAGFRHDYLEAVQAYERVRRAIDAGEPVAAEQEAQLRAAMDAFSALRDLRVGDVVTVPIRLPHSLQHGVRVIEFQTPTYERHIISFAQRVLSQDHWDTAIAVQRMRLDAPPLASFERLAPGLERIVAFSDFRVWRLTLQPGATFVLPPHPSYALCMVVQGCVALGPVTLAPEQAAFVPAAALATERRRHSQARLVNHSDDPNSAPAVVLIAAPDL
ncbi:MAG: hypothetical protein ACNA7W_14425 [Pseudomonadales bacterium]